MRFTQPDETVISDNRRIIMKKLLIFAVLTLILVSIGVAYAQELNSFTGVGIEVGGCYGDSAGDDNSWGPSFRGKYQIKVLNPLIAEFGISYSFIDGGDLYSTKTAIADARLLYSPFSTETIFPFIYGGFGVAKNLAEKDSDFVPIVPIGLGIQTVLGEQMLFSLRGGYNLALSDELDGITNTNDLNRFTNKKHDGYFDIMLGFTYSIPGKTKKVKKEPEIIIVKVPEIVQKPIIDKTLIDTDGDGLSDEAELTIHKTDPNKDDTDNDGLKDYQEINQYKTNPLIKDTDNDGLFDGDEVFKYKTDPLKADSDSDGLSDGDEVLKYKTDPLKKDTDDDGLLDGEEVLKYKTDPLKIDTDNDGLNDKEEVMTYFTNPLKIDSDDGGMNDGAEIRLKKNPADPKDDLFEMKKGVKVVLHGITFASGKSTIMPVSKTILDKVIESLKANPEVNILIVGHTDSQGNDDYNQKLSQNRAQAVKTWLVENNISSTRVKVVGKGESEPVATNDTADGRAKNRRIEFEVE